MTTVINGTSNAITFPDSSIQNTSAIVSGYVPYANLPTGSVLQVVNFPFNTQSSTTSGTAVNTGITVSITPKFSTSKILVIANLVSVFVTNTANYAKCTLVRNSTDLCEFGGAIGYSSAGSATGESSVCYLDSPSTTSSTTYKIQIWSGTAGQTVYWCNNSSYSTITVMEIAA